MSSFSAVFQERDRCYTPLAILYGLYKRTAHTGQPSAKVQLYPIQVYLDVGDEDANLADWGADSNQRRSGWLLYWNAEGRRFRQVEYRDAYLTHYYLDFKHGRTDWPAHVLVLELSAGAILIDGIEVEAHSTLPGKNSREVRSRARTKAADPAPSPNLRALGSDEQVPAKPKRKFSGRRPEAPTQEVLNDPNTVSEYGKWYYERPYKFRKDVRKDTLKAATEEDGKVYDPLTKTVIDPSAAWDMGHKPGREFRKHQLNAAQRQIGRKQFVDEHNIPQHYRPELPSSNRCHKDEDITDLFLGGE